MLKSLFALNRVYKQQDTNRYYTITNIERLYLYKTPKLEKLYTFYYNARVDSLHIRGSMNTKSKRAFLKELKLKKARISKQERAKLSLLGFFDGLEILGHDI